VLFVIAAVSVALAAWWYSNRRSKQLAQTAQVYPASATVPAGYSTGAAGQPSTWGRQIYETVYQKDQSGDGRADLQLIDTTGDGKAEVVIDTSPVRGQKEPTMVDTTRDGQSDTILMDTTGDGSYDTAVEAEKAGLTVLAVKAMQEPSRNRSTSKGSSPYGYPEYWINQSGRFLNLLESEYIYNFAHDLLNHTFRAVATRDRSTMAAAALPQWLDPVKIWRVENSTVFTKFAGYRAELAKKYQGDGPRAAGLATPDPLPATYSYLPSSVKNGLESNISEHYLFHGTSPMGAVGIHNTGFDPNRAGSAAGSLYGAGLYLAECSSKSDEYATADQEGLYGGHCAMLLCRVVLGSTLTWDTESDVPQIERAMQRGGYDSLLGDREKLRGTFREFILPTRCFAGAYPEYVIIYRRRYDAPPAPAPAPSPKAADSSWARASSSSTSHRAPPAPTARDPWKPGTSPTRLRAPGHYGTPKSPTSTSPRSASPSVKWTCHVCDEPNGQQRLMCNNCGAFRPA